MPPKRQKKKVEKLTGAVKKCHITSPIAGRPQLPLPTTSKETEPYTLVFDTEINKVLLSRWPKPRINNVPAIFLHSGVNFSKHAQNIIKLGVRLYHPMYGCNFTKLLCGSFDDHKLLIHYIETNELPYHTFGHPEKKKMRVVIRGLPEDTDLNKLKEALKSESVPVLRVHKMHTKVLKNTKKHFPMLVLAVVPYNIEGQKLLKLKKVSEHEVTLEPPFSKAKQCHRCQKWGHSQRYCHGLVKCVKCAGDHMSSKCTRDRNKQPPKCVNCDGAHTANYRKCSHCPESAEYKKTQLNKLNKVKPPIPKSFLGEP